MLKGRFSGSGHVNLVVHFQHANSAAHSGEAGCALKSLTQTCLNSRYCAAPLALRDERGGFRGDRAGERIGHKGWAMHEWGGLHALGDVPRGQRRRQ